MTSSDVRIQEFGPTGVPDPGAGNGPEWLDGFLAEHLADLVSVRRELHAHPELAYTESATSALLLRQLSAAGIHGRVLPSGTGVVAEIGSGERVVALRADIDALPLPEHSGLPFASTVEGVSHACGHDIHLTTVLGAAQALTRVADRLPGRVRFIFQPAEEVFPGGSFEVVRAGEMVGVERIFALHCDPRLQVGKVGLRVGAITSTSDMIELIVRGKGGHTARPHLTADLVHALGMVITGLPGLLSRRLDPRSVPVMVWGAVQAGEAANAIPQSGVLRGTLRIMERSGWDAAEPLVAELVAGLLAPTGVEYTLNYTRGVPPVENDPLSTGLLRVATEKAVGVAGLATTEQSTGAEDFANLLEHAPGALARLGVWDGLSPQVDLHSPTFVADERSIAVGVRTLVHTVLGALGPA